MNYKDYKTRCNLSDLDRVTTEFEEKVIRLCHHDFEGLTQEEAAEHLGTSQKKVSQAIFRIKEKAPQLFPILTKKQALIRDYIAEEGLTHQQIAVLLGNSKNTVDSIVATMKAKGVYFEKPHRLLQLEKWMVPKHRF